MPANRRILTTDLHHMSLPADARLSPDGRQVAYVVTRIDLEANSYSSAIWVAAADGAPCPRRFTGADTARGAGRDQSPRWAPEGRQLAFISDRSGCPGMWLLDLATGGEAQPLDCGGLEVTDMAWSPDGAYIAFAARAPKPEPPKPSNWNETGWRPGENPDVTVVTKLRYKFNGRGILDERYQKLHLAELSTGRTWQVTFGPFDDASPCWSPDCRWLLFSSSRHPERELRYRNDVWAVDVSSITSSTSSTPSTSSSSSAAPDPAALTAVRLSATHTGSLTSPTVSPDGHWILCHGTAEEMGGAANTHLWLVPLHHAVNAGRAAAGATGEDAWNQPEISSWLDILDGFDRSLGNSIGADVRTDPGLDRPLWSGDGCWVYFTATDGGLCKLYRVRLPEGVPLEGYVPVIEQLTSDDLPVVGSVSAAHPKEGKEMLALFAAGPASPGDIYLGELEQGTGAQQPRREATPQTEPLTPLGCPLRGRPLNLRRLTCQNAWLEDVDLSRPERVIFPSVEGGRIEGWLMKPAGFDETARYPAVLEIHGGPHVTYGLAFMHEFQVLCARGFAVFFTNPRGSKGYGEAFAARVVGDWAGIDYQDLMAAADWLEKVPWVDALRLGVTGGSQGGYLTNFLIGHTTRFAAAVTQRSMSNLYSKYGVSDIGWTGDKWGMGGKDLWDSEDFIMERSPIRYAPHVRTPVLIIHSEQDLRCPMEQGEQWYIALKRLGVQTEFVRFAGENHELSRGGKPRNRVERLERIAEWFQRFIMG